MLRPVELAAALVLLAVLAPGTAHATETCCCRGARGDRAARTPRRTRWIVLVLAVAAAVTQFVAIWTFDDGARRAVDALRADSVWIEPGSPTVLDVERARQVIGDRPIAAAVLPPSQETFDRCEDIVARLDDVVAFVWTAPGTSAICVGDGFGDPDLVADTAVERLELVVLDAKHSSRYRIDDTQPDRTPQLEEFVLAFDAAVPDAYSGGVPRRELAASPRVGLEIAVRLAAAAAAVVVVGFVALRLVALRLTAARARRRALRTWRLEQLARTARLADAVLAEHPDDVRPGPGPGGRRRSLRPRAGPGRGGARRTRPGRRRRRAHRAGTRSGGVRAGDRPAGGGLVTELARSQTQHSTAGLVADERSEERT